MKKYDDESFDFEDMDEDEFYDYLEKKEYDEKFGNMPKKRPNKELIHVQDIGGISHYSYNVVRYKKYRYDDDVDIPLYGIRGKIIGPDTFVAPETNIKIKKNGKEILLSIYDLAYRINEVIYYGTKEEKKKRKFYVDEIMDWCTENFHPYDIDLLYNKYKKTLQEGEDRIEPCVVDGVFEVKKFMKDLEHVYQAFTYIMALKHLLTGDPYPAYELYKVGFLWDTLGFFEEYKGPRWKKIDNSKYDKNEKIDPYKLVEEMGKDAEVYEKLRIKYEKLPEEKKVKLFERRALSDRVRLFQNIGDFFPDIKMHLKYDYSNNGLGITATIDSVFDICWYTMARMITFYGLTDNDRTTNRVYKEKDWYYDEGTYATCSNCGRVFMKTGNRQKYCNREECQKARKRKNSNDSYARKLLAKKTKAIKN